MSRCLVSFAAWLAFASPVWAQTPAPSTAQAASSPQLGAWWLINARAVQPLPEQWLLHTEGQISYSRTTGNVNGHAYVINSVAVIRKRLFTNLSSVSTNVNEIALGADRGHVRQLAANITDLLLYNVYDRTNLAAGALYERDDPKFVQRRVAAFGGVSQHLLIRPRQTLQAFGGFGREYERGTLPGFDQDAPILYVSEAYNLRVLTSVFVRQALELFFNLQHSDDARRNFSAAVDFQVAKFLAISPSFQIRYDGRTTPFAEKTDTTTMVAVRFTR